jgi:hypothetical protein
MKCLKNMSISQLLKLSQRYDLNPQYKNPRRRKAALIRCLREYWKINPIGECSICWEQIQSKELCVTPCAHLFCAKCLIPYVRESEKCPLCRAECSYEYIINKTFHIPDLAKFLKSLINVQRREEWAEEEEGTDTQVEETDTRTIIYHVNIYIIIQRNLETLNSFLAMFVAVFFAYYYYLFFLRQGIRIIYLCINVFSIFCFIYYMLTNE